MSDIGSLLPYFLIRDRIMKCSHTEYRAEGFHQKETMCALRLLLTCDEESPCVRINGRKPREMLPNLRIDFKIKQENKIYHMFHLSYCQVE